MLILVMIYRPGGLLAARRRRTELMEAGAADAVIVTDDSTAGHAESADTPKTRDADLWDRKKEGDG